MNTTPILKAGAAAALVLGLAACGGEAPSGTAASSAAVAPATSAASAAAPASSAAASATATGAAKVSANDASEDDIKAALEAGGVPNAGRWAEEVVEYRPYPADDPNLTKLRDNLAKYNPGQDTLDKIVATLRP